MKLYSSMVLTIVGLLSAAAILLQIREPVKIEESNNSISVNSTKAWQENNLNEQTEEDISCFLNSFDEYKRVAGNENNCVTEPITIVWTTCNLNLRREDSISSDIITVLKKGTKVIIYNYDDSKLWQKTKSGYLSTQYLSLTEVSTYTYYCINTEVGTVMLDKYLQEYAQDLLTQWDMLEYFPYFICQAFQESQYNYNAVSRKSHGGYYDYGLMQIWQGLEFDSGSVAYNCIKYHKNYKTNPYDSIYCGLYIVKYWYSKTGDCVSALGSYLTGNIIPSNRYILAVTQHMKNLIEVSN